MKNLNARLGLKTVIAISLGSMLGSGIFVLPGPVIEMVGDKAWMAYFLAGLCVLPVAVSKSELATVMPNSGGTYVYLERTFGPLAGTVAGLGLWLSLLLKCSFALAGIGSYLSVFSPWPLRATLLSEVQRNFLLRSLSRVLLFSGEGGETELQALCDENSWTCHLKN